MDREWYFFCNKMLRADGAASDAPEAIPDRLAPRGGNWRCFGVTQTSHAAQKAILETGWACPGPGRDPRIAPKSKQNPSF